MRTGILTLGIIFVMIGIASYMSAQLRIDEYQTLLGQAALLISDEAQQDYQMYQLMQMAGAILSTTGLVVSVAGIAAKEE
ncbi:MAG: hypothetical protein M0Q92_04920 [Methanoregula sp.]|jgi:hypothetical protein|nr:hypothetical protein [Methanoregula sp.]